MNKDTAELEHELTKTASIEEFFDENQDSFRDFDLQKYLAYLCAEKNLQKADVIRASELDYTYGYHIFSGRKKNPSRKKTICLALAMKLSVPETQRLLYYANCRRLYVRNEWDSVIIFALEKNFSVKEADDLLNDFGFETFW